MSARTEVVFLAGGPAHLTHKAVPRGARETIAAGVTYRDTGERWTGLAFHPVTRRAGNRLFTPSGTIRHRRSGCTDTANAT